MRLYNQSERSSHLIYKNLFSIKQYQFPSKNGLNLFKRMTPNFATVCSTTTAAKHIYPRPEVMVGDDRELRAYRQVCGQRGRSLTMTMAISPIKCFLGSCWSNECCVGFSVSFWHGQGKKWIPVFAYNRVPVHLDLAIPPPPRPTHTYTAYASPLDIVEKALSCLKATPKIYLSRAEIQRFSGITGMRAKT